MENMDIFAGWLPDGSWYGIIDHVGIVLHVGL